MPYGWQHRRLRAEITDQLNKLVWQYKSWRVYYCLEVFFTDKLKIIDDITFLEQTVMNLLRANFVFLAAEEAKGSKSW